MTAVALPASGLWLPKKPKLCLDRFDPRNLLRPLKIDGQFFPNQTLHFGGGTLPGYGPTELLDIEVIDDGQGGLQDSGGGTTQHTHNSITSTGPLTILAIFDTANVNSGEISSVTWGGNSGTQVIQHDGGFDSNTKRQEVSLYRWSSAQSGNIVISFGASRVSSYIYVLSLANAQSHSPVDTDISPALGGNPVLDALTMPDEGGARIAAFISITEGSGISFTNATEVLDSDFESRHRIGLAHDTTLSGDISATNGSEAAILVGGSWR